MDKTFNLIITGVGGQGIITLISVIDEAAFLEGYDIKSSELRGLSQRGGNVITHIRFGKKVYSPLVPDGGADLILGLELMEALRDSNFSNDKTIFLVNDHSIGFAGYLSREEVIDGLNNKAKGGLHLVKASDECKNKLNNDILAGIYLLGYAVKHNLIPLSKESFEKALREVIPARYLEMNINAFELVYL